MDREQMDFYFANYLKAKAECKGSFDFSKTLHWASCCKDILERILADAGYDLDKQFKREDYSYFEDKN